MKKSYYYLLLITVLLSTVNNSVAQKLNYRAHVGIGLTDVAHIGLTRRFGKVDIGAQMGYLNHDLGRIISGGVSSSLRFGFSKKYNDAPTIFFKQLLNCQNDRNMGYKEWYWLTTEFLMGRNLYFDKRFGLSVEGGIILTIYQVERYTVVSNVNENDGANSYPYVFPTARIQLFYRF